MWNGFKKVLTALSGVAPNVFEAEVAALLGYAVVLFNLNLTPEYTAALLGVAVLVFTLIQAVYKAVAPSSVGPVPPAPVDTPKGI